MSSKSVHSLTGIRGVAALWVVMHHMYRYVAVLLALPWLMKSSLFINGYRGVDLFFILSGFILMRTHGNDFATLGLLPLKRFFLARFVRVYPLNAVVLLAILVFVILAPGYVRYDRSAYLGSASYRSHNLSIEGFIQSVALAQNWTFFKLGEWNVPAWSLSAEIPGYVGFPLLAFVALRQTSFRRCVFWAAASLTTLTMVSFLVHHAYNNSTGSFGVVRMCFCFLTGILLHRAIDLLGAHGQRHAAAVSIAAAMFLALTFVIPRLCVLDVYGFAVLIASLAYKTGPVDSFLRTRAMLWLGKISFSLYLTQFFLENVFLWGVYDRLAHQGIWVNAAALLFFSGTCLAVAYTCFRLVENPAHRLAQTITRAQNELRDKTDVVAPAGVDRSVPIYST